MYYNKKRQKVMWIHLLFIKRNDFFYLGDKVRSLTKKGGCQEIKRFLQSYDDNNYFINHAS